MCSWYGILFLQGSWGGVGVRKLPPKPQRIKKVAGIDLITRADFNKKHIIISEKRDKKAGKYFVKDLPYPYTSKAQFKRAMETPLGAEWNTESLFKEEPFQKLLWGYAMFSLIFQVSVDTNLLFFLQPGIIINPLEKLVSWL